jgi:hypothetical protein
MVEVSGPSGRSSQDIGAVVIGNLRGEALCNAFMKAVTKAKRRATLSFCGLGDVIDEAELDTVREFRRVAEGEEVRPDAHHAKNHDNATGHGSGAYASPDDVKAFVEWVGMTVDEVNAKWLDHHTADDGEVAEVKPLLSTYQLAGHLYKWCRSVGLINAPDEIRMGQRDKFTAVAWVRDRGEVEGEAIRYAREKWREAKAKAFEDGPLGGLTDDNYAEEEPGSDG